MRIFIIVACLGAMVVSCQVDEGEPAGAVKGGGGHFKIDHYHVTLQGEGGSEEYYIKVSNFIATDPGLTSGAFAEIAKLDEMGVPNPCPEGYKSFRRFDDPSDESVRFIFDKHGDGEGDTTFFLEYVRYSDGFVELKWVKLTRIGDDGNSMDHTYSKKRGEGELHKDTDQEKIEDAFREQVSDSCGEGDS